MHDLHGVPSNLVRDLLVRGSEVAKATAGQALRYSEGRKALRSILMDGLADDDGPGIWSLDDEVIDQTPMSEVSAIDGAMVCDNRAIGDLCSAVAVSVGTTDRDVASRIFMDSVPRAVHNKELISGIMSALEIELAASTRDDLVLLDGAIISGLINISKAIYTAKSLKNGSPLADRLDECRSSEFREQVRMVLSSDRYFAIPKYVTKNPFEKLLPSEYRQLDGKSVATMALRAGELTKFRPVTEAALTDANRQLIGPSLGFAVSEMSEFVGYLEGIHSCFYKPHAWTPAFRIDIPVRVSKDFDAQARILRAIRDTTRASGMLEPLPQYLADQFAKQISIGSKAVVEMSALSEIDDPEARLLIAMGYRT